METLKQLGPARLAIMGGVLVGLLLFFIFVSMRVSAPDMKLLYSDLDPSAASSMVSKLEESDIPFEVSPDNTTIKVPDNMVGRARMLLAQDGLLSGGSMGYEIFDTQSGFGTTNFVQNINQVRALEGELARTIGSLGSVRSARVHLVLPQRELFSRESRPSTASVFLTLRPGNSLDKEQIVAIQALVSSAVPELKPSNVSIIDSTGTLLAKGGEEGDTLLSAKAEEMKRSYEMRMTGAIEDMIGKIVGYGHVRANVTAELNFDRIVMNEELYDPNGQVVRSTQTTEENSLERQPPSGDVSVQNNLPGIASDLLVDPKPVLEGSKTGETTNFEISKTIRNTTREVGEVRRLSVAVLVDGLYTPKPADPNAPAEDEKEKKKKDEEAVIEKVYNPRTQEELDRIAALVKSAIGFDEKRGDVVEVINMQFADISSDFAEEKKNLLMGFERSDLLQAVEVITVAIMIILVILLVVQPMVGRLLATEGPKLDESLEADLLAARPASPQLTGPSASGEQFQPAPIEEEDSMIDMSRVEGKVKASSVKKVEDIVDSYPNETVSVIRSWMSQEG